MNDSLKVARWEIKTIIRSKTFLILTFLVPIIMLVIGGVVGYFSTQSNDPESLLLGVIDNTEILGEPIKNSFERNNYQIKLLTENRDNDLKQIINRENLDGVLVIPQSVFEKNEIDYYFKDLEGLQKGTVRSILSSVIADKRLKLKGYSPEEIYNLISKVKINARSLNDELESGNIGNMIYLPIGLAMMMVFASMFSGGTLMQSIIKEKGNRIVELILSSISARSLMAGKIIGYGFLGLVQIVIWAVTGLVVANFFFDVTLSPLLSIKTIYMLVYFLLGFILVASINAIIGAGTKEAQSGTQANGFLVIIPIIPVYFASAIINSPGGIISKVLSYIPVTSPTTMLLRLGFSSPPFWEIGLTVILLMITNYLLIKLAAKIFRVGLLMYGKNANLKELFRWARSNDY